MAPRVEGMWPSAAGMPLAQLLGVQIVVLLLGLLLLMGCTPASETGNFFPLEPGAMWGYRVADATGRAGARTVRVVGVEEGLVVLESRQDGEVRTTWLQAAPLVLAVREVAHAGAGTEARFEPGALRALDLDDLHRGQRFVRSWRRLEAAGTTEVESTWTVEATGLTLVAGAGTFENVVRVRTQQSDGRDARLYFAPGVGLVRAEGEERLELVHWTIP